MKNRLLLYLCLVAGLAWTAQGQILSLPARAANASTAHAIGVRIADLPLAEREQMLAREILNGNVPDWLRQLAPVSVTNVIGGVTNRATFWVTPDYLAVGDSSDYLLVPLTPATAQLLADNLDCTLPTAKMVDAIYSSAALKLSPTPIPPSPAMTTSAVFEQHNALVCTQRLELAVQQPLGELVAGHKKDVVVTTRLASVTNRVAIYGWHQTNGRPIQPLYVGHRSGWVDYSHGIRLVQQRMLLNGTNTSVAQVLADPKTAEILSDEGVVVTPRYSTNQPIQAAPGAVFGERNEEFNLEPGVRVQINYPATTNHPTTLVLFALPNGNTIEQTVGHKLKPGEDWHFDIQHIGAQTRFLRQVLTNRTVVIAYLESDTKSWPAWRRAHGNEHIVSMVNQLRSRFSTNQTEIVLTGHSGGGSFTFGYLNAIEVIPTNVTRIAFLDSNYAYETANHYAKLSAWLRSPTRPTLSVLAYHDSNALLDGKTFVSERGGTWGRSHAMLADLQAEFPFRSVTNAGLQTHSALGGRLQLLLKENPERKILHTVQVERNGFIHAMLLGTPFEGRGYEYLGERAYSRWIQSE